MSISHEADMFLGKIVIAMFADGSVNEVGRCIAYTDAPTVTIKTNSGKQVNWRADLCDIIAIPEDAIMKLVP